MNIADGNNETPVRDHIRSDILRLGLSYVAFGLHLDALEKHLYAWYKDRWYARNGSIHETADINNEVPTHLREEL